MWLKIQVVLLSKAPKYQLLYFSLNLACFWLIYPLICPLEAGWSSQNSHTLFAIMPSFSSAYIFFLGTPFFDHSISPSLSSCSNVSGLLLQCLHGGGFIPLHSNHVGPFFVSHGAWSGMVVYFLPFFSFLVK